MKTDKSQLQIRPRFLVGLFVLFIVIPFLFAALLPLLASTGRMSGNQKAKILCRWQLHFWKRESTNSVSFDFSTLSLEAKRDTVVSQLKYDGWLKTNFIWQSNANNKEVVIVCGREFDNVHKPGFWNSFFRNPAHAVGYSDGTVGLISPTEFTNLNLNGFVSAASLATNSEFKIF